MADSYSTLEFSAGFLQSFVGREFNSLDRAAFLRALRLLDENERHPSLRVHQLKGDFAGTWSASASDSLRITFLRAPGGRKVLLICSRDYER